MAIEQGIHYRDARDLEKNMGWYMALGIGLIILGIFAIIVPLVSTFAIVNLVGILFAIGGVFLFFHAFRWRLSERFFLNLILGILYFAFGIFLLAYPLTGALTLTVALSIFFLVAGIFKVINSIRMRPAARWGWLLFSGVISIFLGLFLWAGMPLTAFWAIGVIVGIDLIFSGFSMVMLLLALRDAVNRHETFCIGGQCFSPGT